MSKKPGKVRISMHVPSESNTNISIMGETYHVQTEHGDPKNPFITTYIYCSGEIVFSKKTDCSDILASENYEDRLKEIMKQQQKDAIEYFKKKIEGTKKKTQYFDVVKKLISSKNNRQALKILNDALAEFPDDPFIMSYYGYLRADVDKKYEEGIRICKTALKKLDPIVLPDEKPLHAVFYLNLGKACLAGGDRKTAINAFNSGLEIDKTNRDLIWELRKLGTRKRPPMSFLSRKNPINKYLGKLRARLFGK